MTVSPSFSVHGRSGMRTSAFSARFVSLEASTAYLLPARSAALKPASSGVAPRKTSGAFAFARSSAVSTIFSSVASRVALPVPLNRSRYSPLSEAAASNASLAGAAPPISVRGFLASASIAAAVFICSTETPVPSSITS